MARTKSIPKKKGATKESDREILGNAAKTARAFVELCGALDRRIGRVLDMDDKTYENEVLQLACRTGLLTEKESAIRNALHCLRLAGNYFGDGARSDLLEVEADYVAGHAVAGAERLAAVIGALAVELDDADTEAEARALRRSRRAA